MLKVVKNQNLIEKVSKREFLFWHDRTLAIFDKRLVYYKNKGSAGGKYEVNIPIN